MGGVWVVVATSARCRIFTQKAHAAPLEAVSEFDDPDARLKPGDLNTDRPGRTFDSAGKGRHAMGTAVNAAEQRSIRFAKRVADRLDRARQRGRFSRLVLVADPRFLGHLRHGLHPATRSRLTAEIGKNLAAQDPESIRNHLPYRL